MADSTFSALAPVYHQTGVNVIPIVRGEKRPPKGVRWGIWQDRRQTETELEQLMSDHPAEDVGIILGSAFADIETDGEAGERALRELRLPVPRTAAWKSPRGWHRLYRLTQPVGSIVGLRESLDVLAAGRYVVVPTSVGREWLTADGFTAAVDLPEEWRARLTPARLAGPILSAAEQTGAPEGTRNVTLAALIGRWLTQGLSQSVIRERAVTWAVRCVPPLDHKEAVGVIERVLRSRERGRSPERDAILRATSLDLGHPERAVYIALVALWGELGLREPLLFASDRMVSKYAGVSFDGVRTGVERLRGAGLIETSWGRDPWGRRTRLVRLCGVEDSNLAADARTFSSNLFQTPGTQRPSQSSTKGLCTASRAVTNGHAGRFHPPAPDASDEAAS